MQRKHDFFTQNPFFQLLDSDEGNTYRVLCEECQFVIQAVGFELHWQLLFSDGKRWAGHHATSESLEKAARRGCAVCGTLWRKLSSSQQSRLRSLETPDFKNPALTSINIPAMFNSKALHEPSDYETASVEVIFNDSQLQTWKHNVDVDILDTKCVFTLHPPTGARFDNKNCPVDSTSWSARSIDLATYWINQCTKHHSRCSLGMESPQWYPTRLIDIGDGQQLPRLVITSECSPVGPYLALSHCWGQSTILRLTNDLMPSFQDGSALGEIPKTFEHAMAVTRTLQARYIWIDSLCIIQDDSKDWLNESSMMHKVYLNALCNISATGAINSSEGLFFPRDPCEISPIRTYFQLEKRVENGYDVSEYKNIWEISEVDFWKNNVIDAPLGQRGWVFQERLLSQRVLHFGKSQILWECCELEAAEKYPSGLPAAMIEKDPEIGLKRRFLDTWMTLDPDTNQMLNPCASHTVVALNLWNGIIRAFSSTVLTVSGDKLAALSGIAKRMKEVMRDEYVAGLWRKNLLPQLLWSVDGCQQIDGKPSVRPASYRSPSFSWAAIDGIISPVVNDDQLGGFLSKGRPLLDVLEISTTPESDDETGPLRSAYLRLAGTLKRLELYYVGSHIIDNKRRSSWVMIVNGKVLRPKTQGDNWRNRHSTPSVLLDVNPPCSEGATLTGLYCVNVFRAEFGSIDGLLLESVPELPGAFRRIGTYTVFNRFEEAELIDIILENNDNEGALPCDSYCLKEGKHEFRLI